METIKINWEKENNDIPLNNNILNNIYEENILEKPNWIENISIDNRFQSDDIIYDNKLQRFAIFNKYASKENKAYIQLFKKNNPYSLIKESIISIENLNLVDRNGIICPEFEFKNNRYFKR